MPKHYTLQEVCRQIGKNHIYIGQIQSALGLHRPEPPKKYSRAYINFLSKCTAMRLFGVGLGDLQDLFRKEQKLLRMLHVNTHNPSPSWYLDGCTTLDGRDPHRLLLTGFDVGFNAMTGRIQGGLDFGTHEPELFDSKQMGEDLDHVLELYRQQVRKVQRRVEDERGAIRSALSWSTKAFSSDL